MQPNATLKTLAALVIVALFSIDSVMAQTGSNEGRKRGARGGALLGLTMGIVAGDSRAAVAGAVVGGVAGGVAGDYQDYQEDRQDYRTDSLANAIASQSNGGQGEAPQSWSEIDSFIGSWAISMWSLDEDGNQVDASARATSSLNTTSSITFNFSDFNSDGVDLEITGSTTLSFQADRGFELVNHFSTNEEGNRFVGHFDNPSNKYVFFYAGTDQETFTGVRRTDYRLEMQMIGGDVIVMETWAAIGGDDKRLQSYRFTRTGG